MYLTAKIPPSVFWEARAFPRRSGWLKTHPFATFCSTAHALHSTGFSQQWRKSSKISGFFAFWNFLTYYSNKLLKPPTALVIFTRKRTHGTSIEQKNCRFILTCLFLPALLRIRTTMRKKLCSPTLSAALIGGRRLFKNWTRQRNLLFSPTVYFLSVRKVYGNYIVLKASRDCHLPF